MLFNIQLFITAAVLLLSIIQPVSTFSYKNQVFNSASFALKRTSLHANIAKRQVVFAADQQQHSKTHISSSSGQITPYNTSYSLEVSEKQKYFASFLLFLLFFIPESAHADVTTWIQPIFPYPIESYWKYFLSGAISASLSHGVTVPFDVVKTKIQTSAKSEGKSEGLLKYSQRLIQEEGAGVLFTGMAPTLIGYWIQGSLKYGLYELFKPLVKLELLSNGLALDSIWIFMIASAMAESIASSTLSPFEASRIRMVSSPGYATSIQACVQKMIKDDGLQSLFAGLPAILLKNVPYTVVQLSSFEIFTTFVYGKLSALGLTKAEALHYQVEITIVCALVAAFLATLASQPGDSLLSAVNKAKKSLSIENENAQPNKQSLLELAKSLGFSGLYRGLKARLIHVSFIVVIQLTAYDYIKQLCGIPATGFH